MLLLPFLIAGVLISQDAKVTPHMSKDLAECPGREGLMITVVSPPGASDPSHRHNECLYEAPGNNPPHKSHGHKLSERGAAEEVTSGSAKEVQCEA